jgi:uncharacterized membrane protein
MDVAGQFRSDTNPELNILLLMLLSGAIAAVGLATDSLHLVIGAMVVAPGFEPFLRLPFALMVGPRRSLRAGATALGGGYALLALGAAVTYLLLDALGQAKPLDESFLVAYWTSITASSVVVAVAAGLAGVITVTANRSVFTAGVMIALALVPSMALTGIGLVSGEGRIALDGFLHWLIDGAIVVVTGALVIGAKHTLLHDRTRVPG